jgi:hypothetical protein
LVLLGSQLQLVNSLSHFILHSRKRKKYFVIHCNPEFAYNVEEKYKFHFPIGSSICVKCKLSESFLPIDNLPESDEKSSTLVDSDLFQLLGVSPLDFKITESLVFDISPHTIRYMKRKYNELLSSFNRYISECMAPGQGKELMDILSKSEESKDEDLFIEEIAKIFTELPTTKAKIQLVSTLDPQAYSNIQNQS